MHVCNPLVLEHAGVACMHAGQGRACMSCLASRARTHACAVWCCIDTWQNSVQACQVMADAGLQMIATSHPELDLQAQAVELANAFCPHGRGVLECCIFLTWQHDLQGVHGTALWEMLCHHTTQCDIGGDASELAVNDPQAYRHVYTGEPLPCFLGCPRSPLCMPRTSTSPCPEGNKRQ